MLDKLPEFKPTGTATVMHAFFAKLLGLGIAAPMRAPTHAPRPEPGDADA